MPLFGPPNIDKLKGKGDIKGIIRALGYRRDPHVRQAAAFALGELGDEQAIEALVSALEDSEPAVVAAAAVAVKSSGGSWPRPRKAAEEAIAALGAETVGPLFSMFKNDDNAKHRDASLSLLTAVGERAVGTLVSALRDDDPDVVISIANALERIHGPRAEDRRAAVEALAASGEPAIEPIIAACRGFDEDFRETGGKALFAIGQPGVEALVEVALDTKSGGYEVGFQAAAQTALVNAGAPIVPALLTGLQGEGPYGPPRAARLLGQVGDKRAVEPLIAALRGGKGDVSREIALHEAAAQALGAIGDPRAVEPLAAALQAGGVSEIAVALGEIGDSRAVPSLIAALETKGFFVMTDAARALGKIGDPRAVEPLISALNDNHGDVRSSAADALGKIGDPRAVDPLIAALESRATSGAASALGKIGDPRAVAPLVAALQDDDMDVRDASKKALGAICGESEADQLITRAEASKYLTDNSDGTITDRRTGLIWQRDEDGEERKYGQALGYCQSLDLAGYDDWRLPRKEELVYLATLGYGALAAFFPDLQDERYWAESTPDELYWAESPNRIAYTVDFDPGSSNYGRSITYFRVYGYYVRAVRSEKG